MGAYGWKATIGFIGPPRTNETVLHEAFELAPPGISWCWSVMGLPEFGQFEFDEALASVTLCAKELAARGVDVIVAAGIPLITSKPPGYHLELEQAIADATGHKVAVTTDIACVMAALNVYRMERVSLCSIYKPFIRDNVRKYLAAYGISVVADVSLDFALADCMTQATLESSYTIGRKAAEEPEAEGVMLACPQWPVIHNVPRIERETGKTVVAHLPAIYWGALSRIGMKEPRPAFGRLLDEWPAWVDEAGRPTQAAAAAR